MSPHEEFTVKDLVLRMDEKLDRLIGEVGQKASADEVSRLRHRLNNMELIVQGTKQIVEAFKTVENKVDHLDGRVRKVEENQITEEAVNRALEKQRTTARNFALGIISVVGFNTVVNIIQG